MLQSCDPAVAMLQSCDPVVVMLQSCDPVVAKRAGMFKDIHLRSLRQKLILKQRTEEAASKLEVIACSFFAVSGNLTVGASVG